MKEINKIYLSQAIFLLISISLIVFFIYPNLKDIKKTSSEILSDRAKASSIYMQDSELDYFNENFQRYEVNLNKIEKLFIDQDDPIDFIEFLEKNSYDLNINLSINLISDPKKEASDHAPFSSFQINARGNFQDILIFVEKLEKGPYLLQINSLSFNKLALSQEEEKKSPNMVEANLLVQVTNK